ncbi:MAG: adenylate/guanylate cyclase domain-containing protein [Gemmatimonadota bacterium]|nr:adenylate/guanylate cyclase domain-containing protein [Gemmatimonadota bacterium]
MPFRVTSERVLVGLAAGAVAATLALLVGPIGLFDRLETRSIALRVAYEGTRTIGAADTSIVIVDFDEASLDRYEEELGRWPWPGRAHAEILEVLGLGGPRIVGTSLPLERSGLGEALSRALAAGTGPVVPAIRFEDPLVGAATGAPEADTEADTLDAPEEPHPLLVRFALPLPTPIPEPLAGAVPSYATVRPLPRALSRAAGLAAVPATTGSQSPPRGVFLLARHAGAVYPGVPLALVLGGVSGYRRLLIEDGTLSLEGDRVPLHDGRLLPHWRGSWSRQPYPIVPAWRLLYAHDRLEADETPDLDLSLFAGRTVLIGSSAPAVADTVSGPFAGGQPAVLLHATALDTIRSRDFLHALSDGWALLFTLGFVVGVGVLAGLAKGPGWRIAVAVLTVALLAGSVAEAYVALGWVLPVTVPALGALLAVAGAEAGHRWTERRRRDEIKEAFGKFIPENVIEEIASERTDVRRRVERVEISILFADVRNFTALAEAHEPERLVEHLNQFFSSMVEAVFRHGGTLDKYLGDGLMAFFGAPLPDARHPERACLAAREMLGRLDALNRRWEASGAPRFEVSIGIHTGEALVGFIGDEERRMEYTAIGDAVNLASRLERLTRDKDVPALVSGATAARAGESVPLRRLETARVRGRTEPVEVYGLEPAEEDR